MLNNLLISQLINFSHPHFIICYKTFEKLQDLFEHIKQVITKRFLTETLIKDFPENPLAFLNEFVCNCAHIWLSYQLHSDLQGQLEDNILLDINLSQYPVSIRWLREQLESYPISQKDENSDYLNLQFKLKLIGLIFNISSDAFYFGAFDSLLVGEVKSIINYFVQNGLETEKILARNTELNTKLGSSFKFFNSSLCRISNIISKGMDSKLFDQDLLVGVIDVISTGVDYSSIDPKIAGKTLKVILNATFDDSKEVVEKFISLKRAQFGENYQLPEIIAPIFNEIQI